MCVEGSGFSVLLFVFVRPFGSFRLISVEVALDLLLWYLIVIIQLPKLSLAGKAQKSVSTLLVREGENNRNCSTRRCFFSHSFSRIFRLNQESMWSWSRATFRDRFLLDSFE